MPSKLKRKEAELVLQAGLPVLYRRRYSDYYSKATRIEHLPRGRKWNFYLYDKEYDNSIYFGSLRHIRWAIFKEPLL